MVTLSAYGNNVNRKESFFWGLSTDTKPTDNFTEQESNASIPIENGSIIFEMDTGKAFVYDRQNKLWRELI